MRPPVQMLKKAVRKKRKATAEAGGSRKQPRARSPGPHPADQQTSEEVTPPIAPPVALQTELTTTSIAGPQIDLTTDTPQEEPRATANNPSTGSADPVAAPTFEEDPPTSGGTTTAAKAIAEGAPTHEGREETSPTPEVEAAPSGSIGPARRGGAGSSRSRGFLTYDGRAAERLLTRACPPELRAEFGQLGSSAVAEDPFATLLWVVTSVATLRDTVVRIKHADQEVSTARARAEQTESALGAARREAESALEAARKEAEEV